MANRRQLFKTGSDQPLNDDARQARVAAIKRAVAAGTYRCQLQDVADALLLDLLWEQWQRRRLGKQYTD